MVASGTIQMTLSATVAANPTTFGRRMDPNERPDMHLNAWIQTDTLYSSIDIDIDVDIDIYYIFNI